MAVQRRFKATMETVYRDLQATLRHMGASNLKVGQEFDSGEYEIVFDRTGRRYVFRCKKWANSWREFTRQYQIRKKAVAL